MSTVDVSAALDAVREQTEEARGISNMARGLVGSEILAIAGEIRAMIARGEEVLNLTIGDFSSRQFPIPELLGQEIKHALDEGHSNYPPPAGVPECREAIQGLYERRLGLRYPIESILVTSGARPAIAGTYLSLMSPGDRVLYGLPSWNNNHYCNLVGAKAIEVATSPEHGFFPRAADLERHLSEAHLLILNSPKNPTGTVIDAGELERICKAIVEENRRRASRGAPSLYLMFDQVYWLLTLGDIEHAHPVGVVPEMAPYTIYVDGISKGFAATGLRVGWAVGPTDVMKKMTAISTHLGSWAPRPEQIATSRLLNNDAAIDAYLARVRPGVLERLEILNTAAQKMKSEGLGVDAIAPQGAIYLSIRFDVRGKKTQDGQTLGTDEDVRKYILAETGVGLIPFRCFGLKEDTGWFRISVGTVSKEQCATVGAKLQTALQKLS